MSPDATAFTTATAAWLLQLQLWLQLMQRIQLCTVFLKDQVSQLFVWRSLIWCTQRLKLLVWRSLIWCTLRLKLLWLLLLLPLLLI